jgi:hypothetical protein
MRLHLNATLSTIDQSDDLTSLEAVAPSHVWVTKDEIVSASGRGDDPEWLKALDGMIAYAQLHGFTDAQGRIRAHVVMEQA